jgi:hypothetical protein
LGNGPNRVLWKPVFLRPDGPGVLREAFAGIQSEGEGGNRKTNPGQFE